MGMLKNLIGFMLKLSIHSCICKSEESLIQSHSKMFQVLSISTRMIYLMQGKDCLKTFTIQLTWKWWRKKTPWNKSDFIQLPRKKITNGTLKQSTLLINMTLLIPKQTTRLQSCTLYTFTIFFLSFLTMD